MNKHIIVYSKHILLHHVAILGGPESPRRILKIYSISTVDCTPIFRSLQYMFSLLTGLLGPQRQTSLKFVQVCCCWVSTGKQELALNTHWSANKLFKYFRVPCHWDPQIDNVLWHLFLSTDFIPLFQAKPLPPNRIIVSARFLKPIKEPCTIL